MPRVIHFEIPVRDAGRARQFYTRLFDWGLEGSDDEGYWLAATGPEDEPGVNGALITRSELHASPVLVVGVASVDDVLARAGDHGAEVLLGKRTIPSVGYSAYLRDPEGNVLGIFEPVEGPPA